MAIRRKVLVKGIIRGEAFRKQAALVARELSIRGWVRSRTDGMVEACFEGDATSVDAMLVWCFIGPERVKVEEVQIRKAPYRGRFSGFEIRDDKRTADMSAEFP